MTIASPLLWSLFAIIVAVSLLLDFFALNRQGAHRVSMREAGIWSAIWVALSLAFAGFLYVWLGGWDGDAATAAQARESTMAFLTGYLVEKALAVDNIFVFLMVFTFFGVPAESQKRGLMIGILAALLLRAILILVGAWLLSRFHWLLYVFGAFLVFTGVKMALAAGDEPDLENNRLIGWVRRRIPVSPGFDGDRLVTTIDGRRIATPMLLVVLLIGIVDVVFAVDSIPAIFAITTDPFIVLTSNVFAILGLRAMYFLLAGLQERFHLLPYGLAVVLVLIGAKMLLIDLYKIPVSWSLGATAVVLAVTMIASLWILPRDSRPRGAYPFQRRNDDESRN